MDKPIAIVCNASLICTEDHFGEPDKFILKAMLVVDGTNREHRGVKEDSFFYTTPIIKMDLEKRTFETKNTIYQVVPQVQAMTYKLCVPKPESDNEKFRFVGGSQNVPNS